MIRLIWWGVLALAGMALALFAVSEQGNVSLQWSGYLIETSVSFLILVLLIIAAIAFGLLRMLSSLASLPQRWRLWRERKRAAQPMKNMVAGVQALALQQEDKAFKALTAGKDDSLWVRSVISAELAHAHQQAEKRDSLIRQALALAPEQAFTIQMLHIRWLLPEDPAAALVIIDELRDSHPKQRTLMALRAQALEALEDWDALTDYLPIAKKALSNQYHRNLQHRLFAERLAMADDRSELDLLWNQLSKAHQREPMIVQSYVSRALTWGKSQKLWDIVVNSLDSHWNEGSLQLLARLMGQDLYQELKQVNRLQKRHAGEPMLWWLSGMLAQQQGMIEMAEHDFKRSLGLGKTPQAALSLSELYAQQNNAEAGRLLLSDMLQKQNKLHALPALPKS